MKFKQIILILFLIGILSTLACVSASQLDNNTAEAILPSHDNVSIQTNSLKDLIINANDNDTIYLDNITYQGEDNTQISLDKSLNFIGSENTVIDGANKSYLFVINDNVKVSFKNIKFINAYKSGNGEDVYGGALEIRNADVSLDNCQFISNSISYGKSDNVYGAAISNEGNLTIINSCFFGNALNSGYKHEGFGGAIYNNGYLYINNTSFIKSRGGESSRGAVIYNNKFAFVNDAVIADTYSLEESMGSAIFNNGDLTLINSIIENNTIERNNFNYIYGNIFNSGLLVAYANIFKNNTAYYKQPNSGYIGCPTIYNVGDLNLSYNAFIDNIGGFEKIYRDVFLNGGQNVYIDNNWWGSNDDPFTTQAINVNKADSWLILDVNPTYSTLDIGQSVNIEVSWNSSNGQTPEYLIPFDVIFKDEFGHTQKSSLVNGKSIFTFNNTQNKGLYAVNISLDSFNQSVIVDVGKVKTNIEFSVNDNIYSNENLVVQINLHDENSNPVNGNVSVSIAGQNKVVNLIEGKGVAVFTKVIPNVYELKIDYEGDDNYYKSSAKTNVTIKKYSVNLTVEKIGDVYVDENFTINILLETEEVEGAANLYINGVYKKVVYLKNGGTIISFSNFDGGSYNLTIEIPGNEYYQPTNASSTFNVLKYDSELSITSTGIFIMDNETLTITTTNDFKGQVILSINGVNNTLYLTNQTTNIILANLASGVYDVDLIFNGNGKFSPKNASTSFKVKKYSSSLIVSIKDNLITVSLSPSNCTGIVSVYVNRKYYQLNLTDGEATFSVEYDDGTNYIYVLYGGDELFGQSSFNTTIGEGNAVAVIGSNVTSYEYTDFNYTVSVFEQNGFAIPHKVISVQIDSKTYDVVTNAQGIGILPLNLKAGSYDVYSTYGSLSFKNHITVMPIEFNLTSTYSDKAIIIAEFDKNITGEVIFTVSNKSEIINIVDGKAIYTLENLSFGIWKVEALYTNGIFNSTSKITAFEVEKLNSTIMVDIGEAFLGQDETITARVNNLTGNITFIVDSNSFTVDIVNQTAKLTLKNLSGGNHNLVVVYDGDNAHKNTTLTQLFSIKTQKTDIVLQINETSYGEDIKVYANITGNASGKIRFTINNVAKTVQIINGTAYAIFNTLNVGTYSADADYLGDDQFMSAHTSAKFKVIRAQSSIEIFTSTVVLDENIRIYAKLSPNATGKVSFRMIDYYSPRDKDVVNSTASWLIAPMQSGQYTIVATYRGDANYYSSSATFILNVSQLRSVLNVEVNDTSNNDNVVIKVFLTSSDGENITGTVTIQLASKTYNINVRDGKGTLNLGKLAPANYSGVAIYEGSEEFAPSKTDFEFTVADSLLKSTLTCENITKYYNGNVKFVIALTNAKGKPISHETIHVTIKGVESSHVTDDEGKVYLDINNTLGKYDVYVEYMGSDSYYMSNASGSVEVLSTIESGDVIKIYGSGTQYFALFKDLNGKALSNTNVSFNIAGKTYNYTTFPNGIVRLNINLIPGTYSIIAYNPQTGEKVKTSLTIFNKLMQNKDVVNYFGAKSVYKVRAYGMDGKPLNAGNVVTFKVNGKTYKVKTDKNGYATLSLKLNPKQYIITAVFNGTKVSNKITVKPVLTTKITSNKKTKKTRFAAKLVNTKGKMLKGKKITFKINGKKYTAKTNKKGVASVAIKLKLKKGTYNVYTIYGKIKVLNKIRVK